MQRFKKQMLMGILTLLLVFAHPYPSYAFIDSVVSIAKEVGLAIQRAAKAMKWIEITREVVSYPNDYIREVNKIMDDIETLKRMAATANLSILDMDKFLQLSKQYTNVLENSLVEFQGIVNIIAETFTMITIGEGDSVNVESLFKDIKKQHKENMQALAGARRLVKNTKALLANCQAANKVVSATKKLK